jgi:alanyl-tRNA synthetase
MTHRLYYTDPYLQAFDAAVQRVETRDSRTIVVLDRTAFYPTSGGQPFDTGTLGGLTVVDVFDEDDGTIAHVVNAGPAAGRPPGTLDRGQIVHGAIDWPRRFDHMQQHTGQHVLSAAFHKLFAVRTVSFHLGADVSTIDLARVVSVSEMASAEQEANRIVWEDRPVAIRFADAEEAARLPLRKEPARGGTLRLIDVEGFDLSACGGTHVSRSGAIGIIAVAGWERFKGGQRIEFVCGGRALRRFHMQRDSIAASVRSLSVLPEEVPSAIERLQADAKEQKRAMTALETELARFRAEELAAGAESTPVGQLVLRSIDADAGALKSLATAITTKAGYVVVLVSVSRPLLLVVARSADASIVSQHVLTELTARFGGRGGGTPELAQAGGLDADPKAVLEVAREIVTRP